MATTRDIKRRIKGVKNIQQITRAMKMVAAAKLRRSQERMMDMRPYADSVEALLARFVEGLVGDENPLLQAVKNPTKTCILTISGDRGLCGSFNTNVIRRTLNTIKELEGHEVSAITVGRKVNQQVRKQGTPVLGSYIGIFDNLSFSVSNAISDLITQKFFDQEIEQVFLVYNKFKSVLHQELVTKQILPFDLENLKTLSGLNEQSGRRSTFFCEPEETALCDKLLPRYLSTQIYRALLESYASEMAARMTAMESATTNAGEMIDTLTLNFNRARQATITQEISEIVGGANALEQS